MPDIRDSLAQVLRKRSDYLDAASGMDAVGAYVRFQRAAADFVEEHGPELMKMLEGKDGR